jgi:hypothetical protein
VRRSADKSSTQKSASEDSKPLAELNLFLDCHTSDQDFATSLAEALRSGPARLTIHVAGSDAESRSFYDSRLSQCDIVVVCWGNASEVWLRAEAEKLSNWQALGRQRPFRSRVLVTGPPPAPHKLPNFISILFQDGQFDKVIDLVEKGTPTAQLLADIAAPPARKAS